MTSDWGLVRTAALIVAALLTHAAHADPFPTRDQNPLLGGLGLPGPMPAHIERSGPPTSPQSLVTSHWRFGASFNWGNTALVQSKAREALLVDAETQEWRLTFQRPLGERFALRLEAPYRRTSAGSLDSFIDDWHDAFGLPEGARRRLPQDQLAVIYERDDVRVFELESPASGVGDIAASIGYLLTARESSSLATWVSVELPTGDSQRLTGNDALDASLVLAGEHRFAERWTTYGQAGVSWIGEGDVLPDQQRTIVWSGMAGLAWRVARPIELKLQVDAHSAAFDDSDLDFLNEAVVLTVGGAVHFDSGWRLDLGVSEDIGVETAPDVVFVIGVNRGSRF